MAMPIWEVGLPKFLIRPATSLIGVGALAAVAEAVAEEASRDEGETGGEAGEFAVGEEAMVFLGQDDRRAKAGDAVSDVALNGTSLGTGLGCVPLQSGEWITVTFSSSPGLRWKPY